MKKKLQSSIVPFPFIMSKNAVKPIGVKTFLFAITFVLTNLFLTNAAFANKKVTGVGYGIQTGAATSGTGTSVTYLITLTEVNNLAPSADNLSLSFASVPTGVTYVFSTTTEGALTGTTFNPGVTNPGNATFLPSGAVPGTGYITLTITTTGTTPAGTYGFTMTVTDNNGGIGATSSSGLSLVVSAPPISISYTGSPYTFTYGTAITPLTPTFTYGGGATSVTSVTTGTALPSGISLTASTGVISGTPSVISAITSYTLTAHYNNGATVSTIIQITVNKAVLTITGVTANNKTYDRTTSATLSGTATLNGVYGSDVVILSGLPTSVFASANAGTGISVTVSGYTITGLNAGNYTLTQPTGLTANITAVVLTELGATASNKTYDGTTTATVSGGVLVGVLAPDVVSVSTTGTFASPGVGTGITVTLALTGANAGNYTLTQPGITANITAKALTISSLTGTNKTYDRTTTATLTGTATLSGVVGSDVVTLGGTPISAFATANVGTGITITVTGYTISGANAGNYTLTQPTGLTANISAKALTVTGASANNKPYDGTTTATITGGTLVGVILPDVVTLSAGGTFASANVGAGISITLSISGANAGNYTLTQPGLTANITAKALTVTGATAANKVYDNTTTATVSGGTLTGVVGSDVVSISTTGTFATSQAGTGIVVTLALTGANAGNYTLTQPGITANITPKALTISGITVSNKNYDGTTIGTISGSATLVGVLGTDICSLSGSPTATFSSKNIGTGISVTIAGYALSGAQSGDYTVTQPTGLTANITAAALTIACTGPTKVTGTALTTGSYTTNFIYYGTATGETITSVTLTPNAAGLSAGTSAGSAYTVTPSAAVGTGGFVAANYSISYVVYNGTCSGHNYVWNGTTSTTWSTATNWTPNGTPGANDDVTIPTTATAPTVTGSTTVNTVTYTGNNTITVNSGLTLTANTGFLINSGVTGANLTFAGANTGTHLNFASAFLTNAGTFKVSGTGYLYITNGSYIYNSGIFTLNNNATLYLTPGNGNAAAITNDGTFYAGTSGSNCNIEVDDYGSITNSGNFYLGPTSILYYYNDNAQFVTFTNEANGVFTLQSDATGSASIGEIPQGRNDTFVGTYSVQRYFQGGSTISAGRYVERNYRIISSCVNNGLTVSGNSVFGLNYIVGPTAGATSTANSATNAFITGCSGGTTSAGNPSVYLYRESITPSNKTYTDGNFLGVTDIVNSTTGGTITASDGATYSLPVGTGVYFFFRGAASNWSTRTAAPYVAPENVTLTATGSLNQGSYTYADWYTPASTNLAYTGTGTGTNFKVRGYNVIGNPYACAIDWCEFYSSGSNGITRTNISPTMWVFNPVTSQYDTYLATSSSGGTATGSASRYIASGQGFVVQATAANPKLVISEYAKVLWNNGASVNTGALPAGAQLTGSNLLMSTTPQQAVVPQTLRLKLVTDSINFDDIVLGFNSSASTAYDPNEDGKYMAGSNAPEGLASFSSDGIKLAINNLPPPKLNQEVIRLHAEARKNGTYTFQRSDLQAVPRIYDIWLMDKYKKDSLDIRNNSTYIFDINMADTTSYGDNRFSLVIRQNPQLAVHLLNFTATRATAGSQVVWVTENEENYTNFTVERSIDGGKTFNAIDDVPSSAQGSYSFMDASPQPGADMYRLKIVDLNGTISYSNAVTLMYGKVNSLVKTGISVYPNPTAGALNLNIQPGFNQGNKTVSFAGASNLSYNIQITNMLGAVMKTASITDQSWQTDVSKYTPGTYVIQVVNKNDKSVVGKGTFIKL